MAPGGEATPLIEAGRRALIEILAPTRCADCNVPIAGADARPDPRWPLCLACTQRLPFWRRIDGCPRCGTRLPLPESDEMSAGPVPGRAPARAPATGTSDPRACPGCLSAGSALHRCHTLLRYEGCVRRWVPAFKNPTSRFGPSAGAARALDRLASELARQVRPDVTGQLDLIVPVPLHRTRRLRRGFNHVDPIARRLALALDLPWQAHLLERIRDTRPQASLEAGARDRNMRGAFRVRRPFALDLRIGLVDDVLTTGSTLEAAADTLLEAGALEVRALTLAATLPPASRRPRQRRSDRPRVAGGGGDRPLCSRGSEMAPR